MMKLVRVMPRAYGLGLTLKLLSVVKWPVMPSAIVECAGRVVMYIARCEALETSDGVLRFEAFEGLPADVVPRPSTSAQSWSIFAGP